MEKKEHVLVSACLLGFRCRYDGEERFCEEAGKLMEVCHLIPVCPEQMGGLKTPRIPAERSGIRVINQSGEDVTEAYQRGGKEALKAARLYRCKYAVLKEKSPSCGCGRVYDGTFSRTLTEGDGVATAMLKEHGIQVFGESQIARFREKLFQKGRGEK